MSVSKWDTWDKQIERDLREGRLDKLIAEAEDQYKRGLTFSFDKGKRIYQHLAKTKRTQPK